MLDTKFNDVNARMKIVEARFQKQDEDEAAMKEARRLAFIELGKSVLATSNWMIEDYERLKKRVEQENK